MNITATASTTQIAKATGQHETTVLRRLKKEKPLYKWVTGKGGQEKRFFVHTLSEELRIALARENGVPVTIDPAGEDALLGAEQARQLLADQAEEQERQQMAKEDGLAAFERLSEKRKDEARARFSLLQQCDAFVKASGFTIKRYARRSKVGDMRFVQEYNSGTISVRPEVRAIVGNKISYSTLRRIDLDYYKFGLAGLAFRYHNPKRGSTALTEEQQELVLKTMCRNPRTSNVNIRKILQGRFGMQVPTAGIINRFRERWIKENHDLWLFYTNPDEWKSKHMFAFGSASDHVTRLNQLWEADSTPADLMLTDGRYSLIGMIDVYSRRLRLLVSKTSRAASVIALIRHSLVDWGVPEVIKTDNGKDYVSNHVIRVLHGLKIEQQLCTPFQGQEKPHIERAFRTFLHSMVELMPNYIGHNVAERKAIEARRSFAERVMNKESDPVEVNMTSRELQKICNEWTEFVYQYDEHRGLDGKKPIDMVRNWQQPVRRINDMRALDMLLMPAPKDGGIRKIRKKGILVDNRCYQSKEFAGKVGSRVFVLLDPADMGTAYVYLIRDNGERSFLCPAIDPEWVGIDTAAFSIASRKHQDKLMREGRKQLAKWSREEGKREAYADYINLRKQQVENLVEFPEKTEEYSTPGLQEATKAVDAIKQHRAEQEADAHQAEDLLITEPREEVVPEKEEKVVKLIQSDTEYYQIIRERVLFNKGRKLTRSEYDFLNQYYETPSGESFIKLEGDFRLTIGLGREQAEK